MRTSKSVVKTISLSGEFVETPKLFNDVSKNANNLKSLKHLIEELDNLELVSKGNTYGFQNINKEIVLDFLNNYETSSANIQFDSEAIIDFIKQYAGNELNKWDIVFLSGESPRSWEIIPNSKISLIERSAKLINDGKLIQISGTRNRLGSMSDSRFGLTDKQIEDLKFEYRKNHNENQNIDQKFYFSEYVKRNPLLMIYMISIKKESNIDMRKFENDPLVGISIGIPWLSDEVTKYAHYQVNKIFASLESEDYDLEDENNG